MPLIAAPTSESTSATPEDVVVLEETPAVTQRVPTKDEIHGGHHVDIAVFAGPFDLLLHLIAKRQLDITEVDLADITTDFLEHLAGLDEIDLETATHFLVVAATLIEIKAARLLPTSERSELDDALSEARDMLYARLLEYRAFREVAEWIRERAAAEAGAFPRAAVMEPAYARLMPDTPLTASAEDLARFAALATAPRPEPKVRLDHIRRSFISIRDAAVLLLDALPHLGEARSYRAIVEGRTRGDRIVFFLAVLELCKLGHVDVDQPTYDDDLMLERSAEGRDLGSVTEFDLDGGFTADQADDRFGDVAETVVTEVPALPDPVAEQVPSPASPVPMPDEAPGGARAIADAVAALDVEVDDDRPSAVHGQLRAANALLDRLATGLPDVEDVPDPASVEVGEDDARRLLDTMRTIRGDAEPETP